MAKKIKTKAPLTADQLCATCDASIFDFRTTKDLKANDDLVGQQRALGVGDRKGGYRGRDRVRSSSHANRVRDF